MAKLISMTGLGLSDVMRMLASDGGRIHREYWTSDAHRRAVDIRQHDDEYIVAVTHRELDLTPEDMSDDRIYTLIKVRRRPGQVNGLHCQAEILRNSWHPSREELLATDWVWMQPRSQR